MLFIFSSPITPLIPLGIYFVFGHPEKQIYGYLMIVNWAIGSMYFLIAKHLFDKYDYDIFTGELNNPSGK